jgi:hypothetical protein
MTSKDPPQPSTPAPAEASAPAAPEANAPAPAASAPELSAGAAAILGGDEAQLLQYVQALEVEGRAAGHAARVVEEVLQHKPLLGAPYISRLVKVLVNGPARGSQAAAIALPMLAKVAPAKVARHLDVLREGFDRVSEPAKDGMVRVFIALCVASVAYQRRVIDVLEKALAGAEAKTLVQWTELALPALKGEPHAQARAVVEGRLYELPKPQAQRIADFLGVKLRVSRP